MDFQEIPLLILFNFNNIYLYYTSGTMNNLRGMEMRVNIVNFKRVFRQKKDKHIFNSKKLSIGYVK